MNKFSSVSSDRLVWKDNNGNEAEVWIKEYYNKKSYPRWGWKWKVHKLKKAEKEREDK